MSGSEVPRVQLLVLIVFLCNYVLACSFACWFFQSFVRSFYQFLFLLMRLFVILVNRLAGCLFIGLPGRSIVCLERSFLREASCYFLQTTRRLDSEPPRYLSDAFGQQKRRHCVLFSTASFCGVARLRSTGSGRRSQATLLPYHYTTTIGDQNDDSDGGFRCATGPVSLTAKRPCGRITGTTRNLHTRAFRM